MPSLDVALQRHALHYATVLRSMHKEFIEIADRDRVVDRFEADWGQMQTAQAWAAGTTAPESGDPLLARLFATYADPLVRLRRRPSVVRQWIASSVSDSVAMQDPGIRAENLNRLAITHYHGGEFAEARRLGLEALEVHRLVDRSGNEDYVDMQEAGYRANLGSAEERLGNRGAARAAYESARAVFHRLGESREEGRMWLNLGTLLAEDDAHEDAIDLYERAAELARGSDDPAGVELALGAMGNSLADLDRLAEARVALDQALTLARLLRDKAGEALRLGNLARVELADGDVEGALRMRTEALALAREMGDPRTEALQLFGIADVHVSRREDEVSVPLYAQAEQIFAEIGMVDAAEQAGRAGAAATVRQSLRSTIDVYNGLIGQGRFDEAIDELNRWSSLGHRPTRRQESMLLGCRGIAEYRAGRLEQAAFFFSEALRIDAELPGGELTAGHLGNVGGFYRDLGDFRRAELVYLRGLEQPGITDALRDDLINALHLARQGPVGRTTGGLDVEAATDVGLELANRSLAGTPVHVEVAYINGLTITGRVAYLELGSGFPEITLELTGGIRLQLAFERIASVQVSA